MMKYAFDGYETYAWGCDQLKPITKQCSNWYGDVSVLSTAVDALDTLFIMDLKEEYKKAKKLVLEKLSFDGLSITFKLFETNIRVLGGLLSAYELDGDVALLKKAKHVADYLVLAFETPTGMPMPYVRFHDGRAQSSDADGIIAELGTLQLEFQYLSDVTGDPSYGEKVRLYLYLCYQRLMFVGPVCVRADESSHE